MCVVVWLILTFVDALDNEKQERKSIKWFVFIDSLKLEVAFVHPFDALIM